MASSDSLGPVTGVVPTRGGVDVTCAGGRQRIDAIADGLVRVRVARAGVWREEQDWDVLKIPSGLDVEVVVEDHGERWAFGVGTLRVEIDRGSGGLHFVTEAGQEIAADDGDAAVSFGAERIRVRKRRHPDERHAGFGERSALEQTAGTKTFWNVNAKLYGPDADMMYCSAPIFVAFRPSVTYGFFLNALGWSQIRAAPDAETWTAEVAGRELDYVVAHGDGPAAVLERLTAVIGRIELPPRWALGYHQSHWGYDSTAKVLAVADQFARRKLPCDAFHLDIDYMDGHQVFTWDPDRFADPTALISELGRRGIRCVTIVDPGVKQDVGNRVFDSGLERDAFLRDADGAPVTGFVWPGRCVLPDFLRPDVRDWWGEFHAVLVDAGVAGIWNDMNEPALYARPVGTDVDGRLLEVPTDTLQGPAGHRVGHGKVHNVYGMSMARAASEALARLRPDARSFSLTRSGFAGIQRYAAVWTGDNTSSWEHLRTSLPMLCNLGLSGIPFVGADIGGFWNDATPELYARWIQAGVLYPMMRAHSHKDSRPNEPWAFGAEVEGVARAALRLRYELRPYLYTLFHGASTTGAPIMRPLLWTFGADRRAAAVEDEVMLGDALLAAPVVHPGLLERDVYLPSGRWYDWWTGEARDGPADVRVDAPLDRLPLFGSAGTLVPTATIRDDGTVDDSVITLRVFPGDGAGAIYDDDGETFGYRDRAFAHRSYRVTSHGGEVSVALSTIDGDFAPTRRLVFVTPVGRTTEVIDTGGPVEVSLPA